jgi:hypothetical protein
LEPDGGQRIDHAGAVHLIDRLLSDAVEDVQLEGGQPVGITVIAASRVSASGTSRADPKP